MTRQATLLRAEAIEKLKKHKSMLYEIKQGMSYKLEAVGVGASIASVSEASADIKPVKEARGLADIIVPGISLGLAG